MDCFFEGVAHSNCIIFTHNFSIPPMYNCIILSFLQDLNDAVKHGVLGTKRPGLESDFIEHIGCWLKAGGLVELQEEQNEDKKVGEGR